MAITPKVLLKRSSVVDRAPSAGDLEYGELAINFADGKLYYKNSSNDIKAFVDSARVKSIADAVVASGTGLFDSSNALQLIDSAYVQSRQTPQDFQYTSLTGSPNIQAMLDSEITALIGGAPGALDTLNELAAAIGDDPNFITTLTNLANAQLDSAEVIALIDSAYVQQRQTQQDFAYSSLTGAPTNVSSFVNDANYLDSNTVTGVIDATYIQANQTAYDFLDSSEAIALIDSAYVQARQSPQDFSYSSLTGAPTNVSDFTNDAGYLTDANTLDSAEVIQLIDSTYVQLRQTPQDFTYSSLTGAPTNVSSFTNDANYLDSNTVTGVIDASYIQANQTTYDFLDSAEAIALIDSAHVQLRQTPQDFAYASLTGAPTNVSQFANDANYLDSNTVTGVIDATYVQSNQTPQDFAYASLTGAPTNVSAFTNDAGYLTDADTLDSAEVIGLVDSAYVQQRQTPQDFAYASLTGAPTTVSTFTNDANYIATNDSALLSALTTSGDVIVGGNLQVNGTTLTVNSETLAVGDNLIYMNQLESEGSPTLQVDVGWAANVNDNGSYTHVGMFRDATDDTFKVFGNYIPEPDSAVQIDTSHASFELAPFAAKTLSGEYLGFDSDFTAKSTTDLSEGSNLYYTTSRADSDFDIRLATKSTTNLVEGTNLYYTKSRVDSDIAFAFNDSNNTVNVTINNYVEDKVDSAYVLARVAAAPFLDSADAIGLIDSAYVQARQDYAYSSLTGVPTNVSTFANDAGYLTDADTLDSAEVIGLVDSAYVQQRQDFAYASLTGVPTNVSQFTNDAGYLTDANTLDSAEVIALIDSAYVQLRQTSQDFAYASLTGAPTNVSDFTNDAGYLTTATAGGLDSANVSAIITNDVDAAFINALTIDADTLGGQTGSYYLNYTNFTNTPNILDSNNVIAIHNSLGGVDSAAVLALVTSDGFTKYDSDNTLGLIDSAYIELRRPAETIFTVVNNGTSAYTFNGDGFSSGRDNPTLYLTRGKTYKFGMGAAGHPFQIRVSDGGSAYNTGVTNNGAETGNIFFTPDMNAPTSLVYQCTVHSGMVGDIVILDNTDIFRDSAFVTTIIDSAYVQLRQTAAAGGTDSATVISLITSTVDSAYVALREADAGVGGGGGTDSATVSTIIINDVDSAYVQARQLNETAAELTQVNTVFTATAGQTSFTGLDIDSDKFQTYLNGLLLPRADFTHNSTQVDLLVAADSNDILEVIKFTGNDTGAQAFQQRHYIYTATSGQTVFTGSDDNSATLSYTQGRINVYLNGLLLLDSADYTQSVNGDTVTFTTGVTAGHVVNIQTLSGNTGAFAPLEQKLYEFIADSAQTLFTGSDDNGATLAYSANKVTVYINGILQTTSDYVATNGTSITLNSAANLSDVITIAKLEGNNVGLDSGQVNALISGSASVLDSAAVTTLINDYIVDTDVALTTVATDQIVDTFSASTYRTAKYIIQMSHSSGYHSNEILLVHDGSSAYMTTYAEVITASSLGTIDADINSGNVRLLFTPTNTNTDINITRINVDV